MIKRLAITFPLIAGTCWGGVGIFVRFLDEAQFDNMTIIFARCFIGMLALGLFFLIYDKSMFKINLKDLWIIGIISVFGFLFMNLAYNESVKYLSLSLAAILLSLSSVFVLFYSVLKYGEKLTSTKVICTIAALFGCFLLSGILESGGLVWSVVGLLFGLGTAICNAAYIIFSRVATTRGYSASTIIFYSLIIASIATIPFTDFGVITSFVAAKPAFNIFVLLGNALLTSVFPNLVFTIALKYVDSGKVAVLAGGAEPASAFIFGLFIYAEIPSLVGAIGMVVTIVALAILTLSEEKEHLEL